MTLFLEYSIIALEWASRIGGLCVIIAPIFWIIFPKAIETWLAKARDKVLHAHSIKLESHRGNVVVKTQITLKVYEQRRSARVEIRKALSGIENAIRETYIAYHRAKDPPHSNDAENNHYRDQLAIQCNNKAVRLLCGFRTMVKDLAGDLGETTAQMCDWVATEQTKYLEPAGRGVFAFAEETEEHRQSADALRQLLASEDQADADLLQGKKPVHGGF
jgi:hypothetical protein